MGRDCAAQRKFPTKMIGAITAALVFIAGVWLTYAYEMKNIQVASMSQASAVEILSDPFAGASFDAKAVYVIDSEGRVRYSLNPDSQLPLASLTKIALVLAVSEVLAPDDVVTLDRDVSGNGKGDTLPSGSSWRVQDLIDFTLVASSNDGADALARAADSALRTKYPDAPTESAALWRMNDIAKNLGLSNTYFANVTGLDESETQSGAYGSAADVAKLLLYATGQDLRLFSATKLESLTITSVDGKLASKAKNTDEALPAIRGLIMGKTGLTDLAGGNLAVVFDARGRRYVAVVLGSSESGRFADVSQIAGTLNKSK